jgi:hypothetical protein
VDDLVAPGLREAQDSNIPEEGNAPLQDAVLVDAVGDDGLPDPLKFVAEMLPGGRATRGRPPIVYVPTLLDSNLIDALRQRSPTLVVLSGNAGDGKTAFLGELIQTTRTVYEPGIRNEYDVILAADRHYRVVLDGSEDAADRTNDALLDDALRAFRGDLPVEDADRGTLIAINKGRLLRFLQLNQDRYPYLWSLALASFLGEKQPVAGPYLLIDLNERTFIGPTFDASLMSRVLQLLVDWEGWSGCRICPAEERCPALANVRLLRSQPASANGGSPAQRLWRVFAAADLDDRVHITARHVVSQLAWVIGSGRRCPDIRAQDARDLDFARSDYVYNSTFESLGGMALGESSALEAVLSTYDPSERDSALRDRRTHALVAASNLDALLGETTAKEKYLTREAEELSQLTIDVEPPLGGSDYRQRTLSLTHALQRKLFLSGESELAPEFVLDTFDRFVAAGLSTNASEYVPTIVASLNAALGLERETLKDLLSPRDYSRGLRGRGFAMLIPPSRFDLVPGSALGMPHRAHPYLETWPRSLLFRAIDPVDGEAGLVVATLSIPLLLFEILHRADRGFRPTSQTERAYMIRLRGFYRRLSEHAWRTQPEYVLYDNGAVVGRAQIRPDGISLMRQ